MQDEEIDKLITDAANQHHPPYDDKAWGKMEALLDQHLPQKKDKRRYVFFILLFLLLGGALGTVILQPWKNISNNTASAGVQQPIAIIAATGDNAAGNTNKPVSSTPEKTSGEFVKDLEVTSSSTVITTSSTQTEASPLLVIGKKGSGENKSARSSSVAYTKKGRTSIRVKNAATGEDIADNNDKSLSSYATKILNTDKVKTTDQTADDEVVTTAATEKLQTDLIKKGTDSSKKTASSPETETLKKTTAAKGNKKKTDKSFARNFAVTATAGTDMSYIELSKNGKTEFLYGAGLTYYIGKHLRVGAGMYTTKKIYTAAPYQYKFAGGTAYPNLTGIDANCKVYEIPVSVYYNFGAVKKHNWFGGTSISSLLMKKETYDYLYKTPAGQTYNYVKTINNENKHYFSVLTLSGGYQYNLSTHFSFLAEPYLKLPLTGIGAGKIKLNSTGLLFTAVYKPFSRSKK